MKNARNIFRIIFLLLAIVLLVFLNGKTSDNTESIAEFKFKMYQKISKDSLDSEGKLNLLVNETSKYIDDSSRVQKGIHYLTGLFVLLIVSELFFLAKDPNKRS
jgi:hypothetical protein